MCKMMGESFSLKKIKNVKLKISLKLVSNKFSNLFCFLCPFFISK